MYDILITNTDYLDSSIKVHHAGAMAISNGKISSIRDSAEGLYAEEIIDGRGLLWMPGLTDAHTHTSQQLLRGRLLDTKPVIWKRVNVPFESQLDEESSRLSALISAYDMIRSGTTSLVDAGGKYPEVFASVFEKAGMRARLTVMTNDNPHAPESLRCNDAMSGVSRLREMRRNLSGNMLPIYSVTTPTAVSEDLMRKVFEAAIEDDVPVETHLNEYASEVTDFIEHYGKRPFEWLEREGYLKARLVAPHCIFLSPEEIEIIREYDVKVAHCPFSNCGKGAPQTPQLLRSGISVGFGTDGAGHGGQDIFREMRLFRGVMNVTRGLETADSTVMPAETLLKMATEGGAATMMIDDLGTIREGARADIIAVDTSSPALWPTQNLVHSLVESATGQDVRHSIIDGRIVMRDRNVLNLDWTEIRAEAERLFAINPRLKQW